MITIDCNLFFLLKIFELALTFCTPRWPGSTTFANWCTHEDMALRNASYHGGKTLRQHFGQSKALAPSPACQRYTWLDASGQFMPPRSSQFSHWTADLLFLPAHGGIDSSGHFAPLLSN